MTRTERHLWLDDNLQTVVVWSWGVEWRTDKNFVLNLHLLEVALPYGIPILRLYILEVVVENALVVEQILYLVVIHLELRLRNIGIEQSIRIVETIEWKIREICRKNISLLLGGVNG